MNINSTNQIPLKDPKNPLVSVIIPNYNHARFLKQRIDSILNQTYNNYEIIILDDCSSDNSREIIKSYEGNPHLSQVVINDSNSGSPFNQWKKGISFAKGELIWIAESDDKAHPDFLLTIVKQLERNPKAVLAFSHSYLIDSNDNIIEKDLHNNSGNAFLIHNGTKFASNILTKRNYIYNASMVVIRQSTFYNIDESLYQDFHSCGDWGFWMGACIQGNVIEICEKLSYYRIHESNETARASRTGTDWLEVAVLLTRFKDILRLKGYKLRVFRGKWTRDLGLSKITNETFYLTNYPEVFGGTKLDIYLYKISTVIDFMYNRLHL